jgi:hypothetical protein
MICAVNLRQSEIDFAISNSRAMNFSASSLISSYQCCAATFAASEPKMYFNVARAGKEGTVHVEDC